MFTAIIIMKVNIFTYFHYSIVFYTRYMSIGRNITAINMITIYCVCISCTTSIAIMQSII